MDFASGSVPRLTLILGDLVSLATAFVSAAGAGAFVAGLVLLTSGCVLDEHPPINNPTLAIPATIQHFMIWIISPILV